MGESFTARERRARALEAAAGIALAHRIRADAPVLLKDSNNTVFHLAPSPVVAKVATSTLWKRGASTLQHELNVAVHLASAGAPVVPPSGEIPPAVYRHGDLEITFWQYCPGEVREEIDRPELVAALARLHAALASYPAALEPFTEDYARCYSLLDGGRLSPELSPADRGFLRRVYERLSADLRGFNYESVPVHSEIHGGNVIWTGEGPQFIDFESCCRGPRELDFLFLSERDLAARHAFDERLMKVLGDLRSFRVAVWCWAQPDRAPEVREAAEYHLGRLRGL
jgi:Ser/Thr protein kinase RdoA (MazF antagonist)